ncbi:MAG: MBL fold metallo-hydrolase [Anaerolineaceae bacterium]|nr:MBL fold metallo-hydrolase [Anaerolineaceae bacterium]
MDRNIANAIRKLEVEPQSIAVWGLGQMGICIKDADQRITLIDPILSNVVAETFPENAALFKREFEPPITADQVDFADLILCTHEHLDHADPLTLTDILHASPQAKCYTTHWAIQSLAESGLDTGRFEVAMPGKFYQNGQLSIHSIPSAHYDLEIDPQKGSRWLGFVFDWSGLRFYHSGDTILYPGLIDTLKSFSPIRMMMLAVNGRDAEREAMDIVGNLHLSEAYELAFAAETENILIGHNDLFAFNSINLVKQPTKTDSTHAHQPLYIELQPGQQMIYRKG